MRFHIRAAMADRGMTNCPKYGCIADDRFYYRFSGNDVQVAVRKDFDRWANSIDFVFRIPQSQKEFDQIMKNLEWAAKNKKDPSEIGEELRISAR